MLYKHEVTKTLNVIKSIDNLEERVLSIIQKAQEVVAKTVNIK